MFNSKLNNVKKIVLQTGILNSPFCHRKKDRNMSLDKEVNKVNFKNLFRELDLLEVSSDRFMGLTTIAADSPNNKDLNRYYNVLPYDQSRVKLRYKREDIFINASYVKVPEANREYILTQGPKEDTVDHFWLMCEQVKTTCIVMLCRCYENSRDKSARYWPSDTGEILRLNYGLEVELVDSTETKNFVIRSLRLTDSTTGTSRDIKQMHYLTWPDFNVPDSPDSFLYFLQTVRETGCFDPDLGPPIVHCSAGIGRSGTFCLVDSCLVLSGKGKELNMLTIRNMLLDMRTQRMGLIQTEEQLRFSVNAIIYGSTQLQHNGGIEEKPNERSNGKRMSGSMDSPPTSKKRKNSDS